MFQLAGHFRDIFGGKFQQRLIGQPRVDANTIEMRIGKIPQHALSQGQLAVQLIAGLVALFALHHFGPYALKIGGIGGHLLLVDPFRGGANDKPALLVAVLCHDLFQPLALGFAFNPLRDPHMGGAWHKNQIAGRQGNIGGQTRAFGTQRIFNHLDHQVLALAHQLRNIAHGKLLLLLTGDALGMRHDIGGVKERRLIQTNIYKSRLHSRQHSANTTFVDIAYYSASRFTLNMDFLQNTAINIRNARFGWRYVN